MTTKLYRTLCLTLAFMAVGTLFTACLHDEDEKFDTPATQRLLETVEADKQLLESAPNGWRLYYFVGDNYSGGGYTYFLRFNGGRVEVGSELTPGQTATSHYDVVREQGPVLTINTYNEVMHALAEPSYEDIEGQQADFEFLIQKTSQDSIFLKGRKWGNKMLLVRMPEDQTWQQYLDGIAEYERLLLRTYDVIVNGKQTATAYFNTDSRRATITSRDSSRVTPFCVTPDGFYVAEAVGGVNGFTAVPQSLSLQSNGPASVQLKERITPEYLYMLLGNSAVGLPNHNASRTISNDIVELFTFTSNDDWIQVSKSGNALTVTADDNASEILRRGSITVEVNGEREDMIVTQYDYERDILGGYYLMYTDRDGEFQIDPVNMREGDSEGQLLMDYTFYYDGNPVPLVIPFTFDEGRAALSLYCGQYLGNLSSYSIFSVFADRDLSAWSAASTSYAMTGTVNFDEDGLYVVFSGHFGATDMAIGELLLMASRANPLTSSSIAGYIGMLYDPILLKTDDAMLAPRLANKIKQKSPQQ